MVVPEFDWNHVYTEDDVLRFGVDALICPFAMAILERARLVLNRLTPEDFRRLALPVGGHGDSVSNAAALSYQLGLKGLGQSTGDVFAASESFIPPFGDWDAANDGLPFEPAVFNFGRWSFTYRSPVSGAGVQPTYLKFSWPLLQNFIQWLSFYFVDGTVDYEGFNPASRDVALGAYADAYFPTSWSDGSNPRASFFEYWATGTDNYFTSTNRRTPPVLGWKMPNWPGPHGFTRTREREITSLAVAGTNGQRARFIVAKFQRRVAPLPGETEAAEPSGVGFETVYSQSWRGPVTHPWVIDPKPHARPAQVAPMPATPEAEYQYSRKIMDRVSGAWVVSSDQVTPPDEITLYGNMLPGDLPRAHMLNEARDAINSLTHTCWPAYDDYANNRIGLAAPTDPFYPDRTRSVGFNARPFGPRRAKIYGFNADAETGAAPYSDWHLLAETPTSQTCTITAPFNLSDAPNVRYAIVDWSPSFAYKASTNPPACPATEWPVAACEPEEVGSSSGESSDPGSSGGSSGGGSSGVESSEEGSSGSDPASSDPGSSASGSSSNNSSDSTESSSDSDPGSGSSGGGPGSSDPGSSVDGSSSDDSSGSTPGSGSEGSTESSDPGEWTPEPPTVPAPMPCASPVQCGARQYSNPLQIQYDVQFGPEFAGMFPSAAAVRNQYMNLGAVGAVLDQAFKHTNVGTVSVTITKFCRAPGNWRVDVTIDSHTFTVDVPEFSGQSAQVVVPVTIGSVEGHVAVSIVLLEPCNNYDCSFLLNLPLGQSRNVTDCVVLLCFGVTIGGTEGEFEYDGKCYHFTLHSPGGTGPSVDNPCSIYNVERVPC